MLSVGYPETSAYIPGYVPSHPSGLSSDCLFRACATDYGYDFNYVFQRNSVLNENLPALLDLGATGYVKYSVDPSALCH